MKNLKIALSFSLIAVCSSLYARERYGYPFLSGDSLEPQGRAMQKKSIEGFVDDSLFCLAGEELYELSQLNELDSIEKEEVTRGNSSRTAIRLIRALSISKGFRHTRTAQRIYADLASVSARLRLYPFAMQCYYQSLQQRDNYTENFTDTVIISINPVVWRDSKIIGAQEIVNSFNDGKEPVACAILLHIKQPIAGRRSAFKGLNIVGHMFITLIKYNTDKTVVCRSFGFYPDKNDVFSATPFHPSSPGVIKDDGLHRWDEVAGKFISHKRLNKILRLLVKYEEKNYNLNHNNCTDFGLLAALAGGIDINDTKGNWPFGRGNTPACAGQSIAEGKIRNMDTGDKTGLFICNRKELFFNGSSKQ